MRVDKDMGRIGGRARGQPGVAPEPALQLGPHSRLLVVAPHPDDETIGAGELIQHVRAAGGDVRVLLLTDGDNNPWPQRWLERRLRVGAADRQRWGRRRREEVGAALARLGPGAGVLRGLGWPDLGVTERLCEDYDRALGTIAQVVRSAAPNLVAMPALGDRHPDHGASHVLVRLALAGLEQGPLQLAYMVHGHSPASGQRIAMPASADQHRAKLEALESHRSQMALSGGRMRRLAGRPEVYERVSPSPRVEGEPRLPWHIPAVLRSRLQLTLAGPEAVRSWAWNDAPVRADGPGRYRLRLAGSAAGQGPLFAKLQLRLPSPWIFDHWGWCEL